MFVLNSFVLINTYILHALCTRICKAERSQENKKIIEKLSYFPYICVKIHFMLARHINCIYT